MAISEFKLELQSGNTQFDGWPWKTIGHLFYATSNFVHHFIAISEFKLELQSGNALFGSKFFALCDREIWRMTLQNNRAPLLCHSKLCVSFCSHLWIQTGVTIWKRPKWGKICFDLCELDLWPLTMTFCMDITFVNGNNSWKFHDDPMTGTLWKRCHRRTDRQTDGQKCSYSCLVTAKIYGSVYIMNL